MIAILLIAAKSLLVLVLLIALVITVPAPLARLFSRPSYIVLSGRPELPRVDVHFRRAPRLLALLGKVFTRLGGVAPAALTVSSNLVLIGEWVLAESTEDHEIMHCTQAAKGLWLWRYLWAFVREGYDNHFENEARAAWTS